VDLKNKFMGKHFLNDVEPKEVVKSFWLREELVVHTTNTRKFEVTSTELAAYTSRFSPDTLVTKGLIH
jgi:hypothetical protein